MSCILHFPGIFIYVRIFQETFVVFYQKNMLVKNIVGYYYSMLIYHISRYIHVFLQGLEIKDKGYVCLSTARKRRVE